LAAGLHTIKVELIEDDSGTLLHTCIHTFAVTITEDINYDVKVDMRDIGAIARKFGWGS